MRETHFRRAKTRAMIFLSVLLCLICRPLAAGQPLMEIGEFSGLSGIRLCWQSWKPDGRPEAIVVMMHGGNNYGDMDGTEALPKIS